MYIKKKKVEIYSHTFWSWLWGSRAKHTRLGGTRWDSNTKKRIGMYVFLWVSHDAFSYFQGQTSKLSFKFCFAGYSFPFISWSPVNTGISFVNKVDTFKVCLENLFNIKDIMGKRNRKEWQRKQRTGQVCATPPSDILPGSHHFPAQGTSKAWCCSLLPVVNHNELFQPCAAPTHRPWRPCTTGARDVPSVSVHSVRKEKKSNSEGTIKPWSESYGSTQEEIPVQRPAWSRQGLPLRTGILGIYITNIRKRGIT